MYSIRPLGRLTPVVLALLLASAEGCGDAAAPTRIGADSAIPARAIVSDTRAGLVASYGFDETSGSTVTDASASGNTGTLGSGVTRSTAGRFGGALSFNGSSTVNIPDAPSLRLTTTMTLEAWVNPSSVTSEWRDVVYKADDNYYLMATSANGGLPAGGASFGNTSATTEAFGTSTLTANTWSHLAVTYDGATIRLYVNGTQVSTRAKTGSFTASSNPLQIGGNLVYGQFFTGLIDEVRVYNRALSATEIQSDMNAPVSGAPASGDNAPPTVAITTPTSSGSFTTTANQLSLGGTANDNVGVASVTWSNDRGGAGTATGTTSWSVPSIALQTGTNVLTVTTKDAANNTSTATLTVTSGAPTGGLVAAYGFDETSGSTAADASPFGNTGTLGGGVTRSTAGRFGGALSFNGSSTVNIPDAPSLRLTTTMTLEAWVNPSTVTSEWRDVVYKADDNYYLMATSANGGFPAGGASFGNTSATTEAFGTSTLTANTWSHLAVTYDGATIRLYVNGTQVSTRAKTGSFTASSNPLQIGGNLVYGQFFTGLIDEVRVYNRALSATEIQSDMGRPVNQTSSGSIPPKPAVQLAIVTQPSSTALSGVALV